MYIGGWCLVREAFEFSVTRDKLYTSSFVVIHFKQIT